MNTCFLFDIDGTLALMDGRTPFDFHLVHTDKPQIHVTELYKHLRQTLPSKFFIVTGRSEDCRAITEKWLEEQGISYDALYMRGEGDRREDTVVKDEIYNLHVHNKFEVLGVFEDRLRVCRMWYGLGLPVFRVGDPDADF